jgi:hypothetical protein
LDVDLSKLRAGVYSCGMDVGNRVLIVKRVVVMGR